MRPNPQHAEPYSSRGWSYNDLGQDAHAMKDWDEAIRLNPQYASAYYKRRIDYHILGQ